MTKKKTLKVVAALVGLALVAVVLWLGQGLLGNPLSRLLADRAAQQHLAATYPDRDFAAEDAYYSFKTGGYYVQIASPTSVDSHFELAFNAWGKLQYDAYESSVLSGWNTWHRLETDYRRGVDSVLVAAEFPFASEIAYGSLAMFDSETDGPPGAVSGLDPTTLELDKDYDLVELGTQYGEIIFYLREAGEPSIERAVEVLLILKEHFDAAGVRFRVIDLVIQQPRPEDGGPSEDRGQLNVGKLSYADLESENILERAYASSAAIAAYYGEKDAEKAEEKAQGTQEK